MSALSPRWSVGRWARHSGQTFAVTEAKEQRACGSKDGRHLRPISSDSCRPLDPPLSCDVFFVLRSPGHALARMASLTAEADFACTRAQREEVEISCHTLSLWILCARSLTRTTVAPGFSATRGERWKMTPPAAESCAFLLLFMIKTWTECRLSTHNARHLFKTVWNALNLILVRDIFGTCLSYNYS